MYVGEGDRRWPVSKAAERLRNKWERRNTNREARRKRAQEFGRKIASELGKKDSTLKKVIGFGSTYETWRIFREDSDIDLAIIGGDWSFLSQHLHSGKFKVSLVDLEIQYPEFKKHVLEDGEILYEKS